MGTRGVYIRAALAILVAGFLVASSAPAQAPLVTLDAADDATGWNSQRKVVRDSAGRLYAAIRILDPDRIGKVRVFQLDDAGGSWSPLLSPPGSGEMRPASLAIDGADRLHLVWAERAPVDFQIFHALWAGTAWTPKAQVSDTPGYSGFPSIAFDRQNRLHVAWYGFDGSTYQVYYRVRAPAGQWEPTEIVSAGLRDANNPALAIGPDDRPHVAWFLFAGATLSLVYTSRESGWTRARTLSDPSARAFDPSLAVAPDDRVFAAWTERYANGTSAVISRHLDAGNWSPPIALAWFAGIGGHPVVALDADDRAFVFWDQSDNAIRYRVFNVSWGPSIILAANGTASFPSVRWAAVANPLFAGANSLDVVWTETSNGVASVAYAGVSVAPAGSRPASSEPSLAFLAAAAIAVGIIAWVLYRRSRFLGRKP